MALMMKRTCEQCQRRLRPTDVAFICTFECTFCPACAFTWRAGCPNCGGELVARPRRRGVENLRIRQLDPEFPEEVDLVAAQLADTLAEVFGEDRGRARVSPDGLRDRVLRHLRPDAAVLLADEGQVVGHTLLRIAQAEGLPIGLFSTMYVVPTRRGSGVTDALLDAGEAWLSRQRLTAWVTDTSEHNVRLIRVFERRGYQITARAPESERVRLSRAPPR